MEPNTPYNSKVDIGTLTRDFVEPESVIEQDNIYLAQAIQRLVGGNYRLVFIWDTGRECYRLLSVYKTVRKLSQKRLRACFEKAAWIKKEKFPSYWSKAAW